MGNKKLIKWVKEVLPNKGIHDEFYKTQIEITSEDLQLLMGNKKHNIKKKGMNAIFKMLYKAQLKCAIGRVGTMYGPENEKFLRYENLYIEGNQERKLIYDLIINVRYL